jgi:hypothetical protein
MSEETLKAVYWEEKIKQLKADNAHINLSGLFIPKKHIKQYQYVGNRLRLFDGCGNKLFSTFDCEYFDDNLVKDQELMQTLINETVTNWEDDYLMDFKQILLLKYFIKLSELVAYEVNFGNHMWGFTAMPYEALFEEFCTINRAMNFRLKMDNLKESKVILETKYSDENIKVSDETLQLIYTWKALKHHIIGEYTDWNEEE